MYSSRVPTRKSIAIKSNQSSTDKESETNEINIDRKKQRKRNVKIERRKNIEKIRRKQKLVSGGYE